MMEAFRRGYRVNDAGQSLNPSGEGVGWVDPKYGYIYITIKFNGRSTHFSAHRLAAFQRFGDALFQDGIEVRHLNGVEGDNSIENIALGTKSQNMMDKEPAVRKRAATTASHSFHDQSRWEEIDKARQSGMSYRTIRRSFGTPLGTLSFRYGKKKAILTA
jgi:hypothetical protein